MSVLTTESFIRYERRTIPDLERNTDLDAGGYTCTEYIRNTVNPDNSTSQYVNKLTITSDPTYASRNALTVKRSYDVGWPAAAKLAKYFDTPTTHWIMGARVEISKSTDAIPNNATDGLGLVIGPADMSKVSSAATSDVQYALPAQMWQTGLRIELNGNKMYTGVSNTSVEIAYPIELGSSYYFEIEVDTGANLFRIWVDDLLLVDTTFDLATLTAAKEQWDKGFAFFFYSAYPSAVADFKIRDVYALKVDGISPSVRLGPTTQVIGELPEADAEVEFIPPVGYAGNYEVAALPVKAFPGAYLAADTVGQFDRYSVPSSSLQGAAAQVHAVGVKAQIANYAAATHTMSAIIKSGGVTSEESLPPMVAGQAFRSNSAYFGVNPDTGAPWTPSEASASEFGIKVTS